MDKIRELQYFIAAADCGSLSGAARHHGVTLPAVSKLVDALEQHLGVLLFKRSARGLTLTPDGLDYADSCRPQLAQLAAADETLRMARQRPQGMLVVGATPFFMLHCVVPALPRFHAQYPDIELDIRSLLHLDDPAAKDCDLLLLHGWFEAGSWVRTMLPVMSYCTVAAPAYWAEHGVPEHPRDLAHHACLCYRNPQGKLLDLWQYRKDGAVESVPVRGWLHSNYREHLTALCLAGHGVLRASSTVEQTNLASGRLVPVLLDWEMMDPPPLALYYRPEQRRNARIRAFLQFVRAQFDGFALAQTTPGRDSADRPAWHRGAGRRASTWLDRR